MTIELAVISILLVNVHPAVIFWIIMIVCPFIGMLIGIVLRYKKVGIWKAQPGQEFAVANSYRPVDEYVARIPDKEIIELMKKDEKYSEFLDLFTNAIKEQSNIIDEDTDEDDENFDENDMFTREHMDKTFEDTDEDDENFDENDMFTREHMDKTFEDTDEDDENLTEDEVENKIQEIIHYRDDINVNDINKVLGVDFEDDEKDDDTLIKELIKDVAPFGKQQEEVADAEVVNVDDIKEALRRLGFKKTNVKKSIDTVMAKDGSEKLSVEEIIIQAMQIMNT